MQDGGASLVWAGTGEGKGVLERLLQHYTGWDGTGPACGTSEGMGVWAGKGGLGWLLLCCTGPSLAARDPVLSGGNGLADLTAGNQVLPG